MTNGNHECKCSNNRMQELEAEVVAGNNKILDQQTKIRQLCIEYNELKLMERQASYIVDNQRKRIEDIKKALELLTKENKYLWGLISLHVDEKHV